VSEPILKATGWTFDLRRMEARRSGASTPQAPTNQIPPSFVGTYALGQVITINPGGWRGSGTLRYTYALVAGSTPVVLTGNQVTLTQEIIDAGALVATVTATNQVGAASKATQPLGGVGGGACDCEDLEAQIAALEAQVLALQGEVAALEAQVLVLQGEVAALEAQVLALEATIAAQAQTIVNQAGEIVTLEAQILAERTAWRVPSLGPETPTLYDPGSLLSAAPTNASGTITFALNAGVTAAALEQGAALVWPLRDLEGRPIPAGRYLDGPARLYLPALPALGSGIRLAIAFMDGPNPATASGFA
jgi:cell division protein FtsB